MLDHNLSRYHHACRCSCRLNAAKILIAGLTSGVAAEVCSIPLQPTMEQSGLHEGMIHCTLYSHYTTGSTRPVGGKEHCSRWSWLTFLTRQHTMLARCSTRQFPDTRRLHGIPEVSLWVFPKLLASSSCQQSIRSRLGCHGFEFSCKHDDPLVRLTSLIGGGRCGQVVKKEPGTEFLCKPQCCAAGASAAMRASTARGSLQEDVHVCAAVWLRQAQRRSGR